MSTRRVSSTLMMLFVLGSSMNAFAQNNDVLDENFVLDEMVVSATRSEKKLLDTAASVSVITDKDLNQMHINNLDEAFVKIPGVYVGRLSGIGSTTSQTVMRGVNAANSVAVLVDGVQVNDSYNGSVTWSAIPVDMVKRVEVLRGPASVLYGGNALAGVINIITKDVDKTSVNLKLSYGSNNTQNHSLYVAGKASDKLDFNVNYEKKKTDGYITDPVLSSKAVFGAETTTTNTGAKRWIIGNKGKRQWDENTVGVGFKYHFDESKSLALDFTKNEYEYSYSAPTSYFGDDIIKKAGTYFSTPGEKASNKYNMTYNDSENGWKAVVGYSDQYKQHDTSISKATDSSKPNTRFSFDLQKNQTISANNNAVFGLNYRKDEMDATVYKLADKFNSDSKIAVDSMASGTNKSFSAYVMDEHKFSDRWTATAGLRYDKWSTDGRILLPNKTEAINYDESTYDNWSPSLSVMYKPEADSSVYLSWGKAFEAPSLYRMYSSSYSSNVYNIANPNLKPQKADNPNLAHVFYLAGFIESWGRGIEKICSACKNAGVPLPQYTINPGDIMIQFCAPEELVVHSATPRVTEKTNDRVIKKVIENLDKKSLKILKLLVEDPGYTYLKLAKETSLSQKTIYMRLKRMQEEGLIERVGSARNGYWKVIVR